MILIVGLGNPGPSYEATRHNIGFCVADALQSSTPDRWQQKFSAQFCKTRISSGPALLLKPLTFMNLSGKSVAKAAGFYQIAAEDMIVIHDELDLPFGTVRVKSGGGTAGHKGLNSIKASIGNTGFTRVRMGIGRPQHGDVSNYVLSPFNPDEQAILMDFVTRGVNAVDTILERGAAAAMNEFNKRMTDINNPGGEPK